MNSEREKIYALLEEIGILVKENEKEDESFRFDTIQVLAALDFAKTEIIRSIEKTNFDSQTD